MPSQTPKMLGDANKLTIINLLRRQGLISRAELAKKLGMTPPSVSNHIARLIEIGLVQIVGAGSAPLGRKPTMLSFNKEFQYVIGIDIGEGIIKLAIGNLTGEVAYSRKILIDAKISARRVLEAIISNTYVMLENAGIALERAGVIVVSVPGIVDKESGAVKLSPVIENWEGVEIRSMLSEAFGKPILIRNDVDAATLGEHFAGRGKGCGNMLFIKMGIGMAARVMIAGSIYSGAHLSAGEIGYMLVDMRHAQESFCRRGALERVLCNDSIDKDYRKACARAGIACDHPGMITMTKLLELEKGGDEIAGGILRYVMNYLAMALVNAISVLDVELIILGGDLEGLDEAHLQYVTQFAERHVPFVPMMTTSALGEMAGIVGCLYTGANYLSEEMYTYW